ncbi:hypothetical protein IJ22_37130 [Paenibacillus naphthalenovorans]|uniref:Uncharacterized protein n=1 Tax=Paenibacillus naphthalenovorans TaxID=162209 RepID=A0A0U2VL46_9BACL|nr:hypothetical protein IJ22_37130 [Paenibacillus naphthalenovorans]SDJ75257.1 hypothetical protein SAMN05421868_14228 [Paenibacillus naphthalenovorans]
MSTYFKKLDDLSIKDLFTLAENDVKEDQHHEYKSDISHPDAFCAASLLLLIHMVVIFY